MKVPVKNMPRLKLTDLLRRRKMSLRQLLDEFGITTFEGLLIRCDRMGVTPPEKSEFKLAYPVKPVNSPQEGVVVLEPPPVVDDISGRKIDPGAPVKSTVKVLTDIDSLDEFVKNDGMDEPLDELADHPQKKSRKKKDS